MVQVKGMPRPLMQRLSRDFAGRVKYSTLWPSRRDSPSEARRAMPTRGDFPGNANSGKLDIFAFYSPMIRLRNAAVKSGCGEGKEGGLRDPSLCAVVWILICAERVRGARGWARQRVGQT